MSQPYLNAKAYSGFPTPAGNAGANAKEGVCVRWGDLLLPLQQAVGAFAVRLAQQEKQLHPHRQPSFDVAVARHACRSMRDGIDSARTRITVVQDVQPGEYQMHLLPMPVDAARFCSLRRLERRFNADCGTRSSVHIQDPPSWLQELFLRGSFECTLMSLPPAASMPQLHTLEVQYMRLPPTFVSQFAALQQLHTLRLVDIVLPPAFKLEDLAILQQLHTLKLGKVQLPPSFDCTQFTGLQHLELRSCYGLKHITHLASCSSLRSLDLTPVAASLTQLWASDCGHLASINLAGCTALRRLRVLKIPALTHLDLSGCVSLEDVGIEGSGVGEVDVGACVALERVFKSPNQQVLGAGPDVEVAVLYGRWPVAGS